MKKIFKFILLFISIFIFNNYVYALTDNEAYTALNDFCYKGTEGKGCSFDDNDFDLSEYIVKNKVLLESGPTRVYQSIDSNGRIVSAVCYRVELGKKSKNITIYDDYDYSNVSDIYEDGIYYFLRVFPPKNDSECKDSIKFIYPAKGLHITLNNQTLEAPGNLAIFVNKVSIGNWTATSNGSCPKYFGSILDSSKFTSDGYGFFFSDNASDTTKPIDQNTTSVSCIAFDRESRKELDECYKDFENEMSSYTCPADLSSFKETQSSAQEYLQKCGVGTDLSYSRINRNKARYRDILSESIARRYTECAFDKCGVTEEDVRNIPGDIEDIWPINESMCEFSDGCKEKMECLKPYENTIKEITDAINSDSKAMAETAIKSSEEQFKVKFPGMNLYDGYMTCKQILGDTLSQVVKGGITVIQIAAAIIAIIKGMTLLIPPIVNKDADKLKEATGKLVVLGILLVVIIIFRPIVRLLGTIFGFDVTCII